MQILPVFNILKPEIKSISLIEKVDLYSRKDNIRGYNYASTIELDEVREDKNNTNHFEALLNIHNYSTDNDNGDLRVDQLNGEIYGLLKERRNIVDSKIIIDLIKYTSRLKPTFKREIDSWVGIVTFYIKWRVI
ncbi:hypothetical protein [Orenia marismortui]|uniref:Uncharacterized protein n=1 Tax=Orenia marismortui TaxID=46469 RepID=A0A4R8GQG9_9FIRM|nr:hypothetical protein [Orenia marismortui]TDX44323.1 hypothetical protein C7959_15710 [Orenia marismortui]